jgi:hypothetical protein
MLSTRGSRKRVVAFKTKRDAQLRFLAIVERFGQAGDPEDVDRQLPHNPRAPDSRQGNQPSFYSGPLLAGMLPPDFQRRWRFEAPTIPPPVKAR